MKRVSRDVLQQLLATTFPELPYADFGLNGLQVEGRASIGRIATAVTASYHIIQQAKEKEVDALIVHHGLLWKGELRPVVGGFQRRLQSVLHANMNLFAYHLPWDAHRELGNNWVAGRELGWRDMVSFRDVGVRGICEPTSLSEFVSGLERYYGQQARVACGDPARLIRSVALISGGAHRELEIAARVGCDAFVTGTGDEPVWHLAKEEGIHFIAMGHAATERIGPIALAAWLRTQLECSVFFLDEENPF